MCGSPDVLPSLYYVNRGSSVATYSAWLIGDKPLYYMPIRSSYIHISVCTDHLPKRDATTFSNCTLTNYTSLYYLCHHMILNRANTPPDVVCKILLNEEDLFAHTFVTQINLL